MLKCLKVALMLVSMAAGVTQLNAAYFIFTGKLAALGGRTLQEAAMGGVFLPIIVGLLLFFWPLYVASQEWKWRKK